jgi:hypothetical protein
MFIEPGGSHPMHVTLTAVHNPHLKVGAVKALRAACASDAHGTLSLRESLNIVNDVIAGAPTTLEVRRIENLNIPGMASLRLADYFIFHVEKEKASDTLELLVQLLAALDPDTAGKVLALPVAQAVLAQAKGA